VLARIAASWLLQEKHTGAPVVPGRSGWTCGCPAFAACTALDQTLAVFGSIVGLLGAASAALPFANGVAWLKRMLEAALLVAWSLTLIGAWLALPELLAAYRRRQRRSRLSRGKVEAPVGVSASHRKDAT
jgi:hypothetical protein